MRCTSIWPCCPSSPLQCRVDGFHVHLKSKYRQILPIKCHGPGQSDGEEGKRRLRTELPSPPYLGGKQADKSWNPSSLAFLGDSVWELYARNLFFHPPLHSSKYRDAVVKKVRAEAQSKAFVKLVEGSILTEREEEILRWGKNASGTLPKRLSADKLKRAVYREATAVECLVGYLYASGNAERLDTIMEYLGLTTNTEAM